MSLNNLRNALPMIAGALAGKQGVKVLQGEWAKTDCVSTIWLPPLPEGDKNVRVKALGFVGHETAHISFTDHSSEMKKKITAQANQDTFFGILNLLEDVRIERLQKIRFPGVSDNLDNLFKILVEEQVYVSASEDASPVKIMQDWMIANLRLNILNQKAFSTLAEESDVVFEKILPKNTRVRLEALAYDVENAKSTLDVFNITVSIMKMIEEEAKKEEEKEKEAAEQQQQSQDSNSVQSGNSDSSQGGDAQDDANDSGEGAGDTGDTGDASDASDEGDDNQTSSAGGISSDTKQKMSDILKSILGAGKNDQYEDIGDVLANQINEIKSNAKASDYDGRGPLRVFNASKQLSKGRNAEYDFQARRAVNALKLKLHTMLQAQTMTSYSRSDSGSRFSKRNLHEIKVGGKVFEKRTEGIDIDLAASILIDISTSMSSSKKLEIAALSGYATSEALSSIHGVTSAVAVFPTVTGVDYISSFGVKPVMNAENFAKLAVNGSTPLSDSMSRVSIDLLQQPQARKILLVITDGEPNYNDQYEVVIKAAENAGIEIMGVGIGVEVGNIFKSCCTINSVDDLPKAMFGMLQSRLSYKQAA